jgi:4-hydroxy-2-oxoheptanedioate aldolase
MERRRGAGARTAGAGRENGAAGRAPARRDLLFPDPSTDRLLANLEAGRPSLCAYVFSDPNLVEVAGFAGFDCFMADMMFTAHDWDQVANLVRAARASGITPLIRVQAYPWGATGVDRRTVSDAARVLALGATAVTVSVSSVAEVRELMRLRTDWHRLIHLRRFLGAADFPRYAERVQRSTLVVPTVESEGGLRDLERIFALDGVRLAWLAAGDLSKILGVPFRYEHPKMLRLVERAVALGRRHGAGVMYNVGLDSPDLGALSRTARRVLDLGVQVVGVGAVEWHLQMALEQVQQSVLGARPPAAARKERR